MDAQDIEFGADTSEVEAVVAAEQSSFRAKPDGESDPAGEAGWYLQRERERRGESLEQSGEATGIHPYHIEAIEFGDMTRMPERGEALEMIALYAQYLGFDPEPLIQHYNEFLPLPEDVASHPAEPAPLSSAKVLMFGRLPKMPQIRMPSIPGGAGGIVASVAGAIVLFAGIAWMVPGGSEPAKPAEQVAAVQPPADDPVATSATAPESTDVKTTEAPMPDDTLAAQAETEAASGVAQDGANLDGLGAFIEQQVPGEKVAANIPQIDDVQQTADGRAFGAGNGGTHLMLKAKAPVWVRIEDAQGNVVMTQMLMKGDTYQVPDRDGLVVIARDGGLLGYAIDGQDKGVLGTPGEILVGRPLDLKALQAQG
jgi:cytoskeleton protein RodZ